MPIHEDSVAVTVCLVTHRQSDDPSLYIVRIARQHRQDACTIPEPLWACSTWQAAWSERWSTATLTPVLKTKGLYVSEGNIRDVFRSLCVALRRKREFTHTCLLKHT